MDRDHVIQIIKTNLPILKKEYGVQHIFLFGSVARNSAVLESDVDILVEFSRPTGLFGLISLEQCLEKLLNRHVDLGTFQSLKPYIRTEIEKDLILVA